MPNEIQDDQELFVIEEVSWNGDLTHSKIKIQYCLIKQAVIYSQYKRDDLDDMSEDVDLFIDSFDNNSISSLLATIVENHFNDNVNDVTLKLENVGRCHIEVEECRYAIGLTKELTYQAFCEMTIGEQMDWD